MSKFLMIVESPHKATTIKKFLGSDYTVFASCGHIMEIPKKGLGIDVENGFIPQKEVSVDKKDIVKKIKDAAKDAEEIILATDPDREGEGISKDIYELFSKEIKKKCSRVTYTEITKKAIEKAIKNDKRQIDENMASAQKARQVLDRLIGYKISPMLWADVASKTSAGRVQSVALKFICEREKEIKDFKPEDFWYIDAKLKCKNGEFSARVITEDKDNRFQKLDDVTKAYGALSKAKFSVDTVERKSKEVKANPPFDTASLQATAGALFGWDLKRTAKLSQTLYDDGKLTYIRSDSFNISDEALTSVRELIKNNSDAKYLPKTAIKYAKKADSASQEAHECIRPTDVEDKGERLEGDEQKLYKLVRDRFIACQMSPAIVDTVVYKIKTNTSNPSYKLISKGQSVKFDGWMKMYKYNSTKEELLPNVDENECLESDGINQIKNETQPPPRYKQHTLLGKLEKDGVGRPATYPTIMEGIKNREYVEEIKGKKGSLGATELGLKVYEYLQKHFDDFIMDVHFTSTLEDDLDIISSGKKTFIEVVGDTYKIMMDKIDKSGCKKNASGGFSRGDKTGSNCPICKNGVILHKKGKFGMFYCCDQYPKCKSIFEQGSDGNFKVKEKGSGFSSNAGSGNKNKEINKDHVCPECKSNDREGYLLERKSQYGSFWGCSLYPKCKGIYEKDSNGGFKIKKK